MFFCFFYSISVHTALFSVVKEKIYRFDDKYLDAVFLIVSETEASTKTSGITLGIIRSLTVWKMKCVITLNVLSIYFSSGDLLCDFE